VGAIKDYEPFDRAAIPQRNAYAPTQPERILYLPAPEGKPLGFNSQTPEKLQTSNSK